jgi:hypothetical protein
LELPIKAFIPLPNGLVRGGGKKSPIGDRSPNHPEKLKNGNDEDRNKDSGIK